MIKSEAELVLMREASRRNDLVIAETIAGLHEGIREDEVTETLQRLYTQHGLPAPAFAIVSFGAHAADPHHSGGHAVLKKGDSVVIDTGSPYEGYHSDMTRTVFCGTPTDEQKKVYETVLAAQGVALSGKRYFDDLITEYYRITWIDANGNVLYDSEADTGKMENHLEREEVKLLQAQKVQE